MWQGCGCSATWRAASVICLIGVASPADSEASNTGLDEGLYEIRFRLELPHLERWAVEGTTRVCISTAATPTALLPILSANNPFKGCLAEHIRRDENSLKFDLACQGRDAAKAHATYATTSRSFEARISMTMGGKNMSMVEVQSGRRVGSCPPASILNN